MIYTKWSNSIGCYALAKNCDWLRQITATVKLDSSVASRGLKPFSEARIELRNQQILKKMLDKLSQFLSYSKSNSVNQRAWM